MTIFSTSFKFWGSWVVGKVGKSLKSNQYKQIKHPQIVETHSTIEKYKEKSNWRKEEGDWNCESKFIRILMENVETWSATYWLGKTVKQINKGLFFLIRRYSSLFAFKVKLIFQQNSPQLFSIGDANFET